MTSSVSLPTAAQCQEALGAVDEIWESVPRGHRAVRKGAYDAIRRILNRIIRYHDAPVAQADEDEEGEGYSQFEAAMMLIRQMDREQCAQVKLLIDLRDFSPEARLEIFDELDGSHCYDCGEESLEKDDHDCPVQGQDNNGDDDDDDGDVTPTPRRLPREAPGAAPRELPPAPDDSTPDGTED